MNFFCFPKKQSIYVIYSSYEVFKSKLLSDFVLQISSKNSIFFRVRKVLIGHCLGYFIRDEIDVPEKCEYVGIVKCEKIILVSLHNGEPTWVWRRKNGSSEWLKEKFIGYQLISSYTLQEFLLKMPVIKQALSLHWINLQKDKRAIHGDFTHFNILVDSQNNIHFIDEKPSENSILFDFFYFYSYLKQCLERCSNLPNKDCTHILTIIERAIKETCVFSDKNELFSNISNISIPNISGLRKLDTSCYRKEFEAIFKNEK